MDETERQLPIAQPQQAVLAMQNVAEVGNTFDEILAALSVMMKVNLDISDSFASHLGQGFNQFRMIFLLGKEKGVARRVTGRIRFTTSSNCRPFRPPSGDA